MNLPTPAPIPDASQTVRGAITAAAQTLGGQKTFASPVDVTRGVISSKEIDAAVYGVSASNTPAGNKAALAAALAAAAANAWVYLPRGLILIDGHAAANGEVIGLAQGVRLKGCGMDVTTLKIANWVEGTYHLDPGVGYIIDNPNDNATRLFDLHAGAYSVFFSDMTMEGPDAADLTMDQNNVWAILDHGGPGHELHCLNVKTTLWCNAIKCSNDSAADGSFYYPGLGTAFTMINCWVRYRSVGILQGGFRFPTTDAWLPNTAYLVDQPVNNAGNVYVCLVPGTSAASGGPTGTTAGEQDGSAFWSYLGPGTSYDSDASCDLINTRLTYNDDAPVLLFTLPQSNGHCHATYIARGVAFSTTGCFFERTGGSGGVGWLHFSLGDSWSIARYSRSVGDYFGPDVVTCMITNANFQSQICATDIHVGNGHNGIYLEGPARICGGCHIHGDVGAGYGVKEESTNTEPWISDTVFSGELLIAIRRLTDVSGRWRIGPGVEIHELAAGGLGIQVDTGGVDIDGVLFDVTGGSQTLFIGGGDVTLNNIKTTPASKGAFAEPNTDNVKLTFGRNNDFGVNRFQLEFSALKTLTLLGTYDHYQGLALTNAVTNASGTLSFPQGCGTLALQSGDVFLNLDGNIFFQQTAGNPTINNFYPNGGIGPGVQVSDHLKLFAGGFTFVVDSACSFSSSGNLVPKDNLLRAAGTITKWQKVPSLGKWVEV